MEYVLQIINLILQVIALVQVEVIVILQVDVDRCRYMKNVTITLSNDLVQVLDNLCEDCNLSRYAFTKEALLEKIERHSKNDIEEQEKKDPGKTVDAVSKEGRSETDFWDFLK